MESRWTEVQRTTYSRKYDMGYIRPLFQVPVVAKPGLLLAPVGSSRPPELPARVNGGLKKHLKTPNGEQMTRAEWGLIDLGFFFGWGTRRAAGWLPAHGCERSNRKLKPQSHGHQ